MSRLFTMVVMVSFGCSPELNHVRLTVPEGGASGLECVASDSDGGFLGARTLIDGGARMYVVVDFLSFEGVSSARTSVLERYCRENGCPIVYRDCREVTIPSPAGMGSAEIQRLVLETLASTGAVTTDAPDGVVVVRSVATTQSCDELRAMPPFAPDQLVGCIYSSPLELDRVRGDIELELDVGFGGPCTEAHVCICAHLERDDLLELCPEP